MQDELDAVTATLHGIRVAKNISLPGSLPDVDYAIWDKSNESLLVCELKWLIEADSTQEVFARMHDLTHGCEQITQIIEYAQKNQSEIMNKLFGNNSENESIHIIGCVVSKKGIRAENASVPVISLQILKNLLLSETTKDTMEIIESRKYLLPSLPDFKYKLKAVKYAGYTFRIPAIIRDNPKTDLL